MNKNLMHLLIVSDRSGSMGSLREEAEGAINHLIVEQQKEKGDCNLTFIEFDNEYDIIADNINIKDFKKYKLVPRGMTALYDAVGRGISSVGDSLAKMEEKDRPALVTVVISTDGNDNTSHEYTQYQVANMIKKQKELYSWQFVFIGVEMDAEHIAQSLNIDVANAINIKRKNTQAAYANTSGKMSMARSQTRHGAGASSIDMGYSAQEKKELGS